MTALTKVIAMLALAAALSVTEGASPAAARGAEQEFLHIATSEDSTDIGCRLQVTIHLEGEMAGHLVRANGAIHVDVLTTGKVSFTEEGQHFEGTFSRPFTLSVRADTSAETTQEYTSVAVGDEGDVAVLHVVQHVTLHADGTISTAFAILHQSCN
jgi:hypothetical protein